MIYILIFLLTGIVVTGLGYWVHRAFHQEWSGAFYKAHMNHHTIQYPATNYLSDKYRSAGKDNTAPLFILAFSPVLLGIAAMMWFGAVPIAIGIATFAGLCGWGLGYEYFHDQFHIRDSWLERFTTFTKWREIHRIHHLDMNTNFGITIFVWDKLFGTFVEHEMLSYKHETDTKDN